MYPIVRWCLGNRPVVLLFALILMGAGGYSVFRLNQELLPSIEFPAVFVLVPDPGAGPETIDRDVSQPLGSGLAGLPRAKHVTSTSNQGFSTVVIEFDLDSNLKDDLDAVNQRLGQVQLPASAGKPLVQTFNFSSVPTITYSIAAADGDLVRATREATNVIAPALQGVPGVGQVRVSGGAQDSVTVTIDPVRMGARGVTLGQLQQSLGGVQVDLPAGETAQGGNTVPVQVVSALSSIGDLRQLTVAPGVRLADIATISQGPAPLNGISRTDGVPSLEIQVIRAANGNAVSISHDVGARMAGLRLDRGDRISLVYDAATDIQASLNDLLLEGLLGSLLAVAVIFLFLRSLRATLVTAVSLPASVLVALLGTQLAGYSLNVLTLAGLTIAVGRIVDDAIVVLENSYRHLQRGEPAREAALKGASEVASAVISSTLTTVAVFLPIGLTGGIISRFFLPFSLTVTISLLASLLVAMTVVPVLVSFFLEGRARPETAEGLLPRRYRPLLAWSLSRPSRKAMVLALATVLLGASLLTVGFIPRNFFAFGGSDTLRGSVTLPPGASTELTSLKIRDFEAAALSDSAVKLVEVTLSSSDFGAYTAGFNSNQARLTVILKTKSASAEALKRLKAKLDGLYGAGNSQLDVVQPGPPSQSFSVTASGRDPAGLRDASDRLLAALRSDGEILNAKSDLSAEKPEIRVNVDPARAAARGLTPQAVALTVSAALNTRPLGRLGATGPQVVARLDPTLISAETLPLLPLGPSTALKDVAAVDNQLAPQEISRKDGTQEVTLTGTVGVADTSRASDRAVALLKKVALPEGVTLNTSGGTNADINDSFNQMFLAIGVAIGLVFLILVAFFRSIVTPFVILLTMPLALIGGFLALFIFGQALGLPALLGVLMVFGIVVSNAILLIDFVERSRVGRGLNEALMLAGGIRVRPILMTAVATIMALLPVALGISTSGGGGLISQSLAIVVEGGLISSTGLTLIVIPVVYSLLKRGSGPARPASPLADPRIEGQVQGDALPGGHHDALGLAAEP